MVMKSMKIAALILYLVFLLDSAHWLLMHIVLGIGRDVVVCHRQTELFPILVPEALGCLISIGIACLFLKRHRKFLLPVPCVLFVASLTFAAYSFVSPTVSPTVDDSDEPSAFFMGSCGIVIRVKEM